MGDFELMLGGTGAPVILSVDHCHEQNLLKPSQSSCQQLQPIQTKFELRTPNPVALADPTIHFGEKFCHPQVQRKPPNPPLPTLQPANIYWRKSGHLLSSLSLPQSSQLTQLFVIRKPRLPYSGGVNDYKVNVYLYFLFTNNAVVEYLLSLGRFWTDGRFDDVFDACWRYVVKNMTLS